MTSKELIKAIKKAKTVCAIIILTSDDVIDVKVTKKDAISQINNLKTNSDLKAGVTKDGSYVFLGDGCL